MVAVKFTVVRDTEQWFNIGSFGGWYYVLNSARPAGSGMPRMHWTRAGARLAGWLAARRLSRG